MDLFGAEEALAVGDGGVVRFLPARALPGFYEAFVVKRKEGNVVAALRVTQQVAAMTEDRVAVEMVDAQTVAVSSAGIPSSMKSFPSMFYRRRLSRYQRLPLMFQDWTFGDFLLFDFAGTFPSNCFLFLETDNGVVSLSLRRLRKEKNVSLKLPYAQVIELGSFDGQIHFVWFSHAVTLLSVRAALASKVGAGEGTQSAKQDFYNLGGYRYKGVIGGFTGFAPRQYCGVWSPPVAVARRSAPPPLCRAPLPPRRRPRPSPLTLPCPSWLPRLFLRSLLWRSLLL